ncbi:MAG: protein kinase [Gemmatimonadales bacterium]|nr:protein kinase [Gemmatimonadales bacterium]
MTRAGTILGRYHLRAQLGAGGMGEVWRAHDANLDREVAIKLLAPGTFADADTHARFRREALALSRLSHPGIATVYDFDTHEGTPFLVMELVTGGDLEARVAEGSMPVEEVRAIGAAIADALHDAHANNIVHRDLKPGNVMLTQTGQPKILDFGIAMLLNEAGANKLTRTGMILGSLPYMAPEQLTGDADSPLTDVYALGVLLFEMFTGRRPFVKERAEALMFEIFGSAPPTVRSIRPETPDDLDRLVMACLSKEPSARPQSAAAVGDALRGGSVTTSATIKRSEPVIDRIGSIAVLPLRNTSGDPTQEYFVDGMTEAIISDLSRIKALRVISRTSAMQYKGSTKTLPEIARELNVDAVLEGSAHLVGARVRVSVQLIAARRDETLWGDRYDRDLVDVLTLQSELAGMVAREIAVQLTPAEASVLARRQVVNAEAHLEVLKSRHSMFAGTKDALEVALRHARRALELAPEYAAAWSALADCQIVRVTRGMASPAEAGGEAFTAAERARELDPELTDAWTSLGFLASISGDVTGGMEKLQNAVELNPGHAFAHNMLSRALSALGRTDEAVAAASRSIELDPLSSMIRTVHGDALYYAREFQKSVFHYKMAIELDPRFDGAHTDMARSLEALGRFDEARAAYEEGRRLAGGIAGPSFGLAHLEAAAGNEAEARRILADLTAARGSRVVSAWGIAALHASLGDVDEAFAWLETAITEKASGLMWLRVHPRLDPIRGDPRYWPLVERVGLADAREGK